MHIGLVVGVLGFVGTVLAVVAPALGIWRELVNRQFEMRQQWRDGWLNGFLWGGLLVAFFLLLFMLRQTA